MKRLLCLLLSTAFFLLTASSSFAFKRETFINYVFPVREITNSQGLVSTLDLPQAIYQQATSSATPLTWLLNFDVLNSPASTTYFQDLAKNPTQEVGALLEITPSLWQSVSIQPRFGETGSFLNSYLPEHRRLFIDRYMDRFFEVFGFYPRSIGTQYLDSLSLEYLQTKYSVIAAVYGIPTPGSVTPTLEGQFLQFPYLPFRNNALSPAQTRPNKLSLSLSFWNPPDVFGNSLTDPQAYLGYLKDLSTFTVSEFAQVTLGTDNQMLPSQFLPTFKMYQQTYDQLSFDHNLNRLKLSEFGTFFNQRYPSASPAFYLRSTDGDQTTILYRNPFYQIRLTQTVADTKLDHLTVFNNLEAEDYRQTQDFLPYLHLTTFPLVTSKQAIGFDFDLQQAILSFDKGLWRLRLTSGQDRRLGDQDFLTLDTQKLQTNTNLQLPSHPSLSTSSKPAESAGKNQIQTTKLLNDWSPYSFSSSDYLLSLLKFLPLLLISVIFFRRATILVRLPVIFGSLIWMLTMYKNASLTNWGSSFWGAHSHDAFVHLSLIQSFAKNLLSFQNPNLAGYSLQNYHFLYDYLLAIIHKITTIPIFHLYFIFAPLLLSLLIGFLATLLMKKLAFSQVSIFVSLLAIYFTGSLGFIPSLLQGKSFFDGESLFWMTQSVTTLINPPFALSLVLLLIIFLLFVRWQKDPTSIKLLLLSLLIGLLIQVKAYLSVLVLLSLMATIATNFFQHRPTKSLISLLLLSAVSTLLFFLPFHRPTVSIFVFSPLWFLRSLFSAQDRLNLPLLANAWQNYLLTGNYFKLIPLQLLGLIAFIIGNLGIRLLSLSKLIRLFSYHNLPRLIFFITVLGLLLPLAFVQSGNSWNSIQFSYYSLFFLSLLLGPVVVSLLSACRNLVQFLLVIFGLLLFGLPTTIGSLKNYTSLSPSTFIPYSELRQLQLLSRQPTGLTLAPFYSSVKSNPLLPPKPLFAFDSTSYITALTGQPTIFADANNLEISGYDYHDLQNQVQKFYTTSDTASQNDFLTQYQPRYLYTDPFSQLVTDPSQLQLTPLFDLPSYKLYKMNFAY